MNPAQNKEVSARPGIPDSFKRYMSWGSRSPERKSMGAPGHGGAYLVWCRLPVAGVLVPWRGGGSALAWSLSGLARAASAAVVMISA